MGSAKHRSWSHTRGNLADACPRALYFQYYPHGDEMGNRARVLRQTTGTESVAGTIVHDMVTLGLRQLIRRKGYPEGLHVQGLDRYEAALVLSRRLGAAARAGKRPGDGAILRHHLYGAEDLDAEEKGRVTVERCLRAFEGSKALSFLTSTKFDRWERILTDTDDVPSFHATPELGFTAASGLRIYAKYDLALHCGDDLYVVDWKTGRRTPRAEDAVRRQLAVYGLWAMAEHERPIERVRLVACWLEEECAWHPVALDRADVELAIRTIEAHDAMERAATTPVANDKGEVVRYDAEREAFPPTPEARRCGWCAYRAICPEGRLALGASDDEVVQRTHA